MQSGEGISLPPLPPNLHRPLPKLLVRIQREAPAVADLLGQETRDSAAPASSFFRVAADSPSNPR